MVSVGSSTPTIGRPSGVSGSANVVPITKSSMPVTETISPALATCVSTLSSPWKVCKRPIFALRMNLSPDMIATSCAFLIEPRRMRPTAMRPRKLE